MEKNIVLEMLRRHRSELEAEGAVHLAIFGSVAREDNDAESDLDVVVKLEESVRLSGFGYFGALARLKEKLESIVGKSVDIVSEPIQSDRLRREIERDRAVAF
ncbi:nucleotidyltransferase family protein [Rhizobium tubonense]|uniref:Polymerase nucleotidyl transferase domain-containing protein n=1 Tax=Rhizobium tubonense TaxID=484088 RepID=A0A2W4C6N4_9HYPH|nr:nucleotidyltransferase domain-containing protein [Rhizobium tubonense]PZM09172.1 hypothetical protein CPY51_27005 [Rhizobium tubonense]